MSGAAKLFAMVMIAFLIVLNLITMDRLHNVRKECRQLSEELAAKQALIDDRTNIDNEIVRKVITAIRESK